MAREVGTSKGALSATECYSLEILLLLDRPTLSEFAAFVDVSLPNATYRVNSLIEKGYLQRLAPGQDQRGARLCVTRKYADFYGAGNPDVLRMLRRVEAEFSPQELAQLIGMIDRAANIIDDALRTGESHDTNRN